MTCNLIWLTFGIKFCKHPTRNVELKANPWGHSDCACVGLFACVFLSPFSLKLIHLKLLTLWTCPAVKKAILVLWSAWHWLRWLRIDQNIKMSGTGVRQHISALTNRAVVEKSHCCPLNRPGLKSAALWRIAFSRHYFSLSLWRQRRDERRVTVESFWTVIAGCRLQLKAELFNRSPLIFTKFPESFQSMQNCIVIRAVQRKYVWKSLASLAIMNLGLHFCRIWIWKGKWCFPNEPFLEMFSFYTAEDECLPGTGKGNMSAILINTVPMFW